MSPDTSPGIYIHVDPTIEYRTPVHIYIGEPSRDTQVLEPPSMVVSLEHHEPLQNVIESPYLGLGTWSEEEYPMSGEDHLRMTLGRAEPYDGFRYIGKISEWLDNVGMSLQDFEESIKRLHGESREDIEIRTILINEFRKVNAGDIHSASRMGTDIADMLGLKSAPEGVEPPK